MLRCASFEVFWVCYYFAGVLIETSVVAFGASVDMKQKLVEDVPFRMDAQQLKVRDYVEQIGLINKACVDAGTTWRLCLCRNFKKLDAVSDEMRGFVAKHPGLEKKIIYANELGEEGTAKISMLVQNPRISFETMCARVGRNPHDPADALDTLLHFVQEMSDNKPLPK